MVRLHTGSRIFCHFHMEPATGTLLKASIVRSLNKKPMKRIIIFLILFLPVCISAQNKEVPECRHDWRFGFAGYPMMDQLFFGYGHDHYYGPIDTDLVYGDYHGDTNMVGLFSAEYSINYTKRFTFAVSGYLNTIWTPMYNYKGNRDGLNLGLSLHVIPTARLNYINRPAFSMYSSIGLGLIVGAEKKEAFAFPTFQIAPLGITFGRKIFGFAEYSAGLSYIGGRAGIGYRF